MSQPADHVEPSERAAPMSGKPVIGLAGGIGSGKSHVASLLRELGCGVIDADALAREAMAEPEVIKAVGERWPQAIDASGRVDRRELARVVFEHPEARKTLEGLIHPRVNAGRRRAREAMNRDPSVVAIVEDCPLLFEAGLASSCDAVVFVDAPRDVRLSRVLQHRGWTEEDLDRRESAQLPLDTKRLKADYVVGNGPAPGASRDAVRGVLSRIVNLGHETL